jgi:branched-subunit amino acid ABC-type transport system permease component
LTALFLLGLAFAASLAFAVLRVIDFFATALFAFGRFVFRVVARRLTTGLRAERCAAAREVERLRPLVTALI